MIFLRLFTEFFKIGLFAVGGGLSTIPFLEKLANNTDWFTVSDLADMIAIAESTPGPIGVNMATYAGFSAAGNLGVAAGILGGVVSTLGLIMPSLIIGLIVAGFLEKFKTNFYVESAFYGIRPAVLGLISAAGFSVFKTTVLHIDKFISKVNLLEIVDIKAGIIFILSFFLIKKFKVNPVLCLFGAAVLGIVLYSI